MQRQHDRKPKYLDLRRIGAALAILGGLSISTSGQSQNFAASLAVVQSSVCVVDGFPGTAPACWQLERQGVSPVAGDLALPPAATNLAKITGGLRHFCGARRLAASDRQDIVCWGDKRLGQLEAPTPSESETVLDVTAGQWHTCALIADLSSGKNRLACWGFPAENIQYPVELSNPVAVAASIRHTCATNRDADQKLSVYCWGESFQGKWDGARLGLNADDAPYCDRDVSGAISCGHQKTVRQYDGAVNLAISRKVSIGQTISLNNKQAQGNFSVAGFGETTEFTVTNPLESNLSAKLACVLYEEGLACLLPGGTGLQGLDVSQLYLRRSLFFSSPNDIGPILTLLQRDVYEFDAQLFRNAASMLKRATPQQREIAANAFAPMLSDFPYEGLRKEKMANMAESIARSLKNPAPAHIATKEDRGFIVGLMSAALQSMRPVLLRVKTDEASVAPAKEAGDIVGLLGRMLVSGAPSDLAEAKARVSAFGLSISHHDYVGQRGPLLLYLADQL